MDFREGLLNGRMTNDRIRDEDPLDWISTDLKISMDFIYVLLSFTSVLMS